MRRLLTLNPMNDDHLKRSPEVVIISSAGFHQRDRSVGTNLHFAGIRHR
jgi:hypothetical protein